MQTSVTTEKSVEFEYFSAKRTCPNCGADGASTAIRASLPAEDATYDEIRKGWRGFFKDSCFFSYARCTSCQQLFAPHYLTEASLGELYGEMDDNIHSGNEQLYYLTLEAYYRTIMRHMPQAKTYCEFGPDIGLLLQIARTNHALTEAVLIEPNQAVWPRLREAAAGLKTLILSSMDERPNEVADNSMDMIVAIHVLDHLRVPSDMLAWVHHKLSPGGIAVFAVHNERSLLARIMGTRFPAYCMQHPQLYSMKTLRQSLSQQGFHVKEISRTANYFPLNYLVSHAIFALTKKHVSLSWPRWTLNLKLGNIIAIASK